MKPSTSITWEAKPNLYEGDISYGLIQTDLGQLFAAETEAGLCQLGFTSGNDLQSALRDLEAVWPKAFYHRRDLRCLPAQISLRELLQVQINLHLCATPFQRKVWQALLAIPAGKVASYGKIAKLLHQPRASQAVGQAVGANTVAIIVPCHRVINANGMLGNYRWGVELKRQLLDMESKQRAFG